MIYIECNSDWALLNSITTFSRKEIVHEFKGKYEICKQLAKRTGCKGLIDEDPLSTEPPYVTRLRSAGSEDNLEEHNIKVLHDRSKDNYLIVLCPRLEGWILTTAKEAGLDVRKYGLPSDEGRLHRHIDLELGKFEKLLEDLRSKNPARLRILRSLIIKRAT